MNIVKQVIATAAHHSPKHANEFRNALSGMSGMAAVAGVVQAICTEYSIGEFPNPFLRETPERAAWDAAVAGRSAVEDEGLSAPDGAVDMPDFAAMTKEKIEQFVLDHFATNLNTKMRKADMIAEAERLATE